MARIKDRQKAIQLRRKGWTYSEIKRKLNLSKGTLSAWLSNYPLAEKELELVKESVKKNKDVGVEKCRLTKQRKKEERLKRIYNNEERWLLLLSERELYIAGLFLYWGEGTKGLKYPLSLNNTDPRVMKFYLFWLNRILKIPKTKIKVNLHLYSDMDIKRELQYWSRELTIPLNQFNQPYVKESRRVNVDHKGYGHGTCGLAVNNVRLKERIMMGIKAIADYYSKSI